MFLIIKKNKTSLNNFVAEAIRYRVNKGPAGLFFEGRSSRSETTPGVKTRFIGKPAIVTVIGQKARPAYCISLS